MIHHYLYCVYCRFHKQRKLTQNSDYVGYGSNGVRGDYSSSQKKNSSAGGGGVPRSESGDRKLAHSAQMYHYQRHKQQMMALEKYVLLPYLATSATAKCYLLVLVLLLVLLPTLVPLVPLVPTIGSPNSVASGE